MKRLPVLLTSLLTVLVVPVVAAPPAVAKGATEVAVTGPGIEHVELGYTRDETDVDVGSLSETSGIYGIFGSGEFAGRPDLTDDELGPRYDLTWYEGSDVLATSHVYPFAEGGAWAEVPEGQRVWDMDLAGGWWHGGAALEGQLVALGAEPPASSAPGASTSSTAAGSGSPGVAPEVSTSSTDVESGSRTTMAGIAGLVALTVLVGAGVWLVLRRGGRLAAWPLHRST
jgi:hypothetical protein